MRRRRQPEISAGRVNADGSIAAGDGFTNVKNSAAIHTVTLASGVRLVSVVTTGVFVSANIFTEVDQITERSFRVSVLAAGGAASDHPFAFVAVGVQQ